MSAKRLTTNAVCAALFVLLSYISPYIPYLNIKLSFASLPVIVSALLFGPVDGMIVGGLGEGIHQIIRFGITPTTPLWILPAVLRGLIVGLYAKKRGFSLSVRQLGWIVLWSSLAVTAINTAVIYLDGIIFGYPTGLRFATIGLRLVNSLITAAIYTLICPQVVRLIQKSGVR